MIDNEQILEYHEYVQQKLKYLERYTSLIHNGEITPEAINHAVASYSGLHSWMITEYEKVCLDYDILKEEYQSHFDEWFIESRNKLNETRLSSKYASATEIEANARVNHRDEYLRYQSKLKILERKVSMYRRLMDNWKNQAQMIIQLSQNSRAEMKALGIQDLANWDNPKEEKQIVKKKKLID